MDKVRMTTEQADQISLYMALTVAIMALDDLPNSLISKPVREAMNALDLEVVRISQSLIEIVG